jgi:hypothetical protein
MWAGDYYSISDSDGFSHGEFLSYIGAEEYMNKLVDNNEVEGRIFYIKHYRKDHLRGALSLCEDVGNLSLID